MSQFWTQSLRLCLGFLTVTPVFFCQSPWLHCALSLSLSGSSMSAHHCVITNSFSKYVGMRKLSVSKIMVVRICIKAHYMSFHYVEEWPKVNSLLPKNGHWVLQFSRSVVSDSFNPTNHSMPGLPVHHQLPQFTQTHVHGVWVDGVGSAIQPSHPLSSPSPTPNPSQHQGYQLTRSTGI